MNCQNVDNPSNIACAGHWFYWHLEGGTLQGGEWRLDTSLKLVCRGMRLYKCIKLYCLHNIVMRLLAYMYCNSNYIICLAESFPDINSTNPCTSSSKDFFVMKIPDDDHGAVTIDMIITKARESKMIFGCCSLLSPLLQVENLKTIMDVMRLSIGTTIPLSPRYSSLNSSTKKETLLEMFPLNHLASQLKNR